MNANVNRRQIADKAIVTLALRNGLIENLHAGWRCPTCAGQEGIVRITDPEMKMVMKSAVDRNLCTVAVEGAKPEEYDRQIQFDLRYTAAWDEPSKP